jgi:uncharacterized membrane protein
VPKWIAPLLLVGALAFSAIAYPSLPARVPIHWGRTGPNGWAGPAVGAFFVPLVAIGTWLLLRTVPRLVPRTKGAVAADASFEMLVTAIVAALVAVHVVVVGAGLGWDVQVERVIPVIIGLLFGVVGLVIPLLQVTGGIDRGGPLSPRSEESQQQLRGYAGRALVIAGVFIAGTAATESARAFWTLACLALITVYSTIGYALILRQRENGRG